VNGVEISRRRSPVPVVRDMRKGGDTMKKTKTRIKVKKNGQYLGTLLG